MEPGTIVASRFEIERFAGAGAMGAVYRAFDVTSGAPVALKVMHEPDAPTKARFSREALILAELSHPGIVRHLQHGFTSEGEPYLVMEWLEGETLASRIARSHLRVDDSVSVMQKVALALGVVHRRGIVHRDIKPSNILLHQGALERVVLFDFGIARVIAHPQELTVAGAAIGTPGYMAPEQVKGERALDARADVFSLGCVLFKCLTGRGVFEGGNEVSVLLKVLLESPLRPSELNPHVPAELDDLVMTMLAKPPDQRPRDGDEVAARLAELSAKLPSILAEDTTEERGRAAVTGTEKRVVSLVLARDSALRLETSVDVGGSAPNPPGTQTGLDLSLRNAVTEEVQRHRGEGGVLRDGSLSVVLSGAGAATDLAVRAARCAIGLRRLLPDAPIAIVSGQSVIDSSLPLGPLIDRGLGFLDLDESGIVLDAVTRGLLDARFVTVPGGDISVLEGERVLEVTGMTGIGAPARSVLGSVLPFFGRDREKEELDIALARAFVEEKANAAIVIGAAGSGKSRLAKEVLSPGARAFDVWTARGDPRSAGSPYAMIAPLVRKSGVLDESPDSRTTGDRIRRAFEDRVAVALANRPLAILLEDLAWGDAASIRCVDGALRRFSDGPLFVIALARPALKDLWPSLAIGPRSQSIVLEPLDRQAQRSCARAILGDRATDDVVEHIVDRAGGNPFFLEELVRAVGEGRAGNFPETVIAMVQARLESLSADARRVLRAASVFGPAFWEQGVARLVGDLMPEEVGAAIAELEREELIAERGESRFFGHREWAFTQASVAEAAYGVLPDRDRARAHASAAEWLESAGERDPSALAEHFERGERRDRSVAHLACAASWALEDGAFATAIARAERAIALGQGIADVGSLYLALAEARDALGHARETGVSAAAALRSLPADHPGRWHALERAIGAASALGKPEEVVRLAGSLEALAPSAAASGPIALFAVQRALVELCAFGHTARAEALSAAFDGAVDAARASASDQVLAGAHALVIAARHRIAGELGAYIEALRDAWRDLESAGELRRASDARARTGAALLELGFHADAAATLDEAVRAATFLGLESLAARGKERLGVALVGAGTTRDGLKMLRAGIAGGLEQGDARLLATSRSSLARALIATGDLEQAAHEAKEAFDVVAACLPLRADALAVIAEVRLRSGDSFGAIDAAQEAMEILAASSLPSEACIRLVHAESLYAIGHHDAAWTAIAIAREKLIGCAMKIADRKLRDAYLTHVPEHARTLALALSRTFDPKGDSA